MVTRKFPEQYAALITEVLQSYPELRNTHIHVKLKQTHPVPYGTTPFITGLLKKPKNRVYTIAILEEADPPIEGVLFKHLTTEMQKGVIAHELFHIVQFQSCSRLQLLGLFLSYPSKKFERKLERAADKGAIDHGYGRELYAHAAYIRTVPGYVEKRPAVNENYLLPDEILEFTEMREERMKINPGNDRARQSTI